MQLFVVRALAVAFAALVLVSCGGGSESEPISIQQAADALRSIASPSAAAAAAPTPQRAAAAPVVDPTSLMDWAESAFPAYFPAHVGNQTLFQYVYRAYPNGIYLGVDLQTQAVVVMGLFTPATDIVTVGHMSDFACRVYPQNCPVLSGVAAKGLLSGGTVKAYNLNGDGSKGSFLGTATTAADGSFSVGLPYQPNGGVLIEISGGSYMSAYDGKTVVSQSTMTSMLPSVAAGGESGLSVNPLTDMSAAMARSLVSSGNSLGASIDVADRWVAWQYGLKSAPSRIVPRFTVSATTTDPQGVQLALVLAALDTLANRVSPANPDALFSFLSQDFSDGVFDGKAGAQPLTLNGTVAAADIGSTQFSKAFAVSFSGTTAGLRPGYLDAQFQAGTITENYQARIIPVYEASSIAAYFPPRYTSPLPNTTSLDAGATGYSCPVGAPINFDGSGKATCGSYYTCSGATVVAINGRVSCSDGGIPIFHAADIAIYTAPSIAPYTASSIDAYQAQTTIADPAAGTIPVFRATAVHLLTPAELAALAAADQAAGDMAAAKVSALGIPTPLQLEWLGRINDAVMASVRH